MPTMTQVAKKILVTCALPYANGSIHLGHMLEHIQADVWVRYQRMRGHEVNFICADDAHGTPIMLKAQQLGITPEQMIGEMSQEHQTDFAGFDISYDNYHSTHSDENRELSELIYTRLKENGFIKNRTISQLYDPEKGMFLPDRFVKGTCPKCKSPDQYGDNCEVCGATYSPTELIDPKSVVSGATPVMRDSEHFFFDLPTNAATPPASMNTGRKIPVPSCITSSVKTLFTSTACSGRPCWKAATSVSRPTCSFTAMSR